jgi:hypothetical protein
MPSEKPQKLATELTTDEAIKALFPRPVVAKAKREARHSSAAAPKKSDPKSMPEA